VTTGKEVNGRQYPRFLTWRGKEEKGHRMGKVLFRDSAAWKRNHGGGKKTSKRDARAYQPKGRMFRESIREGVVNPGEQELKSNVLDRRFFAYRAHDRGHRQ